MNWYNTLKDIYSKLNNNGYSSLANDIHEGQLSGGTSGEIFDIIISKLLKVKRDNSDEYFVIKDEVETLNERRLPCRSSLPRSDRIISLLSYLLTDEDKKPDY